MKSYAKLRSDALKKRRRVVFDNDGGDVSIQCKKATSEELLSKRTTKLVNSGVDTLIYVTRSSGFGQFTYDTKVGQLFNVTKDRYCNNIAHKLIQKGKDCLQIILEYCHNHDLEVFWGMRMNDTHDAGNNPGSKACFLNNKIKADHPERLLKNRPGEQKYGAWSAVDYAMEDIREYAYKFVEEICENYDVDGVELDFFRHPVFFTSTAYGKPATVEECNMMTELILEIKNMIIKKSVERQRAILFAVRVPDSLEYSKKIGLDIKTWLEKGLIDILITGGYFKINDYTYSVKLAKKYGVKYIASLDENRIRDEFARKDRDSAGCYRARAQSAFNAGADGVFLFNYNGVDLRDFSKSNTTLTKDLANPDKLMVSDKDYFVSVRGKGVAAGKNMPYDEYLNIPVLNPAMPEIIHKGQSYTTYVIVGEDVKQNNKTAKLHVRYKDKDNNPVIYINGFKINNSCNNGMYSVYPIDIDLLNKGRNDIKIIAYKKEVILEDMKIAVKYNN